MLKKLSIIVLLLVFVFSVMPVSAANYYDQNLQKIQTVEKPVVFKETIFVTKDGGSFEVGFATVKFPKDFIESNMLPIRFDVEISAVNGVAGIEFTPDVPDFNKDVIIKVECYRGWLYDKAKGKNIWVNVRPQVLKVKHFSRYAFS